MASIVVASLVMVLAVLWGRTMIEPDEPSTPAPGPTAPSDGGNGREVPPLRVEETASLTVPQEAQVAAREFTLESGKAYVATVDVATEKPADSDGVNIFLGMRLTCTDTEGEVIGTAGGTENLLTGEPVTLSNQVLLRPERSGVHRCSVLLNAPSDAGASAGTTFELDTTWTVSPAEGLAVQTAAVERLPMTIPAGSRQMTFGEVIPLAELEGRLQMHASLNLTTCTGIGGSREDGRTWCTEDDVDFGGSTYEIETRIDVIAPNGSVCDAIDAWRESIHLQHYRHHQLLHVERDVEIPDELCGDRVRVSVLIDNSGPASLVVHRESSSLISTGSRIDR
ncbi:hypothetical protein ACT3SY_17765 [Brachybacterium sp. AOP42-E1-35]|uniref:hypothetical protein n=1 Tax=Brachybacterium sp. AOP42-E1-35 TaxID=3457664 RepID=UPI00402AC45D